MNRCNCLGHYYKPGTFRGIDRCGICGEREPLLDPGWILIVLALVAGLIIVVAEVVS